MDPADDLHRIDPPPYRRNVMQAPAELITHDIIAFPGSRCRQFTRKLQRGDSTLRVVDPCTPNLATATYLIYLESSRPLGEPIHWN